jgi:predicted aminopeptidase
VRALHLPDNASYRRYADLGRTSAVWNVIAAPELSLTLQTWCFPVVGCVGYRGYYDEALARAEAEALRAQGLETYVYGVPAYSTLGKIPGAWFADPLLSTFVTTFSELELARLIFHELSHQVAYAAGDTTFNESYATAVERLGSAQWLATEVSPEVRTRVLAQAAKAEVRREDFRRIAMALRERLQALYASPQSDIEKRRIKAELIAVARAEHAALKQGAAAYKQGSTQGSAWAGFNGYDAWFAELNNAQLGVLAAYVAQVGDFERLFERQGRDWPRFHAEVQRLAALPVTERQAALARP